MQAEVHLQEPEGALWWRCETSRCPSVGGDLAAQVNPASYMQSNHQWGTYSMISLIQASSSKNFTANVERGLQNIEVNSMAQIPNAIEVLSLGRWWCYCRAKISTVSKERRDLGKLAGDWKVFQRKGSALRPWGRKECNIPGIRQHKKKVDIQLSEQFMSPRAFTNEQLLLRKLSVWITCVWVHIKSGLYQC